MFYRTSIVLGSCLKQLMKRRCIVVKKETVEFSSGNAENAENAKFDGTIDGLKRGLESRVD